MTNRREFFKKSSLLGLLSVSTHLFGKEKINEIEATLNNLSSSNAFNMPKLNYRFDELEPFIDAKTMEIHYTKHHQGYVDKLNAIKSTNIDFLSSDEVKCTHIDNFAMAAIRNNLGGHYNHTLFWSILKPNPKNEINLPKGKLLDSLNSEFKSIDEFKNQFSDAALKVFGSGWCWLVIQNGKLKIVTSSNQDNPLMKIGDNTQFEHVMKPLLALDVWEHAYYLKYQNKRKDYINAFWNIVNWEEVEKRFLTVKN